MLYCQMPANVQCKLDKKDSIEQNKSCTCSLGIKCDIARMEVDYDSSILNFVTGSEEIKLPILV